MPWQAVFFDFDGVIADSIEVKVKAFALMFAPYGVEVQAAVMQYHRQNGGMPRLEKLRHCYQHLAQTHMDDEGLNRQAHHFADLVLEEVIAAPLLEGAMATLRQLQQAAIPAFVVSGTPHEEMQTIVARKGLQPYFTEVHGSPRSKTIIIQDILDRYHFKPTNCIFLGDALADYQAAKNTGLHFLGITAKGQPSLFPDGVPTSSKVGLPPL